MRHAGKVAAEILRLTGEFMRPGVTTEEVDEYCHQLYIERNAYPSTLNYHHYPKSLCTSANEVICHGIPDSRAMVDGDIMNLDVTAYRRRRARRHQRHVPDRRRRSAESRVGSYHRGIHVEGDRGRQARVARSAMSGAPSKNTPRRIGWGSSRHSSVMASASSSTATSRSCTTTTRATR